MNYGRYQILEEIGKGSMGVVYRAHDPNLDLTVALKVLRQDRVVSDAFVRRFLSEARVLGRLDNPNIVRVFNVDEDEGSVYIAMEFVEGESLDEIMKKKRFRPEEIVDLGATVAESLDYAHQNGIVHRDIKPSNILIRPDGRIKITDFGIAHIEDYSAPVQTQAGEILGTPAYMSPEQVLSRPVDGRSDLFSLGIILYELCTGTRPFGGQNLAAIFNAITAEEPPRIDKGRSAISPALSQVIMRCLRKTPDERHPTGKALAAALRGSLAERKPVAVRVPPGARRERKIALLFLAGALLSLGILGGVYFYFEAQEAKTINEMGMVKGEANTPPPESGQYASLLVESTPIGAQVFVDGTFRGITPMKLEAPLGKREVRLVLADYLDWEAQVQLKEEGGVTPLSVQLISAEQTTR